MHMGLVSLDSGMGAPHFTEEETEAPRGLGTCLSPLLGSDSCPGPSVQHALL